MRRELRFDVVVIGAGVAGLVAAARLAQGGARVCVVAKGVGCTHLAPGTIDVLGYLEGRRVDEPLAALARLAPEHPYSLLGADAVATSLRWLSRTVEGGPLPGYRYVGGPERNLLLPTALGALRPSALVPATMAAGDAAGLRSVAIVGSRSLRDFHASLCAANLREAGVEARAVEIELETDRADASTLGIARGFDDAAWRSRFCARLSPLLGDSDQVGLPAMLGLRDPQGAHADVERRLGRRVFEIPTLPPSVPGMRLYEILASALRAAGGRLVLGGEVVAARRDGDGRVLAVATGAAGHPRWWAAPGFVLASGGFGSGAIALDSRGAVSERVLGLALSGVPEDGQPPRFAGGYFDEQPLARAGVAVDAQLRAVGAENVVVAGASLPGAVPWREGCGEGVALASGWRAAEVVAAAAGAGASA